MHESYLAVDGRSVAGLKKKELAVGSDGASPAHDFSDLRGGHFTRNACHGAAADLVDAAMAVADQAFVCPGSCPS